MARVKLKIILLAFELIPINGIKRE